MSSIKNGIEILMPYLFVYKTSPESLQEYLNIHFNLSNKIKDITFPLFYNFMELPLFISNILYNAFKLNNTLIMSNKFIEFCTYLYLGNCEKRIDLLFSILNMENLNKINVSNTKIFFAHLKTLENTTEKQLKKGYEIIEDFFRNNKDLSYEEFKTRILKQNADLLYLFLFLLIKFCPINKEGLEYFIKYFTDNKQETEKKYFENIQKDYFKLPFPTESLQEFFNVSYNFNFIIIDELSVLNEFEFDLTEIKNQIVSVGHVKNSYFSSTNLKQFPEEKPEIIPVKNRFSACELTFSRKKVLFNKDCTFYCFVLKKNKFISCIFEIVGKDIFIYGENLNLVFIIPITKLYIEFGDKKNKVKDENYEKIPIYFNSYLFENNIKKYVLYFNDNSKFEKINDLIIKNQKFHQPDFTKYKFDKIIGKGSFGEVFKYYDIENNNYIAIKKIKKSNMLKDENYFDKWERDICYLLKNYSSPYLIKIYNIFEDIQYIYIIQEFAEEGNLKNYIINHQFDNQLNNIEKNKMIRDIAKAIEFLHSLGIIHRDLKLENILLSGQLNKYNCHQIKIIDFSLSVVKTLNEKLIKRYGTITYIPPEIILEQPYNDTIDIWAFGIISFMIINNGLHPFVNNLNNSINTQFFNNILYMELSNYCINEKYKIIFSCLAKTSEDRPKINQIVEKFQSLIEASN